MGDLWREASRITAPIAPPGDAPGVTEAADAISSPASREAGRLIRSSQRAEAQPNARYLSDLWPIMLSAVFTAL